MNNNSPPRDPANATDGAAPRPRRLLVLDWDDSCLPSSQLRLSAGGWPEGGLALAALPRRTVAAMEALDGQLCASLATVRLLTDSLLLLTAASPGWVTLTAHALLPLTFAWLARHGALGQDAVGTGLEAAVHAHAAATGDSPLSAAAAAAGATPPVLLVTGADRERVKLPGWKADVVRAHVVTGLRGWRGGDLPLHVLGVGDSLEDRAAVRGLAACTASAAAWPAGIVPKTVKLLAAPSPHHLLHQHQTLAVQWPALWHTDAALDLCMSCELAEADGAAAAAAAAKEDAATTADPPEFKSLPSPPATSGGASDVGSCSEDCACSRCFPPPPLLLRASRSSSQNSS